MNTITIQQNRKDYDMSFLLRHLANTISFPFECFLGAINKILPAGHQKITPGEISPNSGPIDVEM